MGSKYLKQMPTIKVRGWNGSKQVIGGGAGPKTAEDRRQLLCPQAQSVVAKFGGPRELARIFKECSDDPNDHYNPSTIYRWMYPKEAGGCGGELPLAALQLIMRVARLAGVILTTADIYPHLVDRPEMPAKAE